MAIDLKRAKLVTWITRVLPEELHTKMRVLAGEKRTTMQVVHAEALEIGLGVIEAEVKQRKFREEEVG